MGLEVDFEAGVVKVGDREVWVRAYPLPIDSERDPGGGRAARGCASSRASCCAAAATT